MPRGPSHRGAAASSASSGRRRPLIVQIQALDVALDAADGVPFGCWRPALLGATSVAARADDLVAAKRFVERLYAAYHGDGPDYLGRQRGQVFSPRMVNLLRRDEKLTPKGDVGALDGDPICDCQDFDISRVRVDVASTGPGHAPRGRRVRQLSGSRPQSAPGPDSPCAWPVADRQSALRKHPDLAASLRNATPAGAEAQSSRASPASAFTARPIERPRSRAEASASASSVRSASPAWRERRAPSLVSAATDQASRCAPLELGRRARRWRSCRSPSRAASAPRSAATATVEGP